MQIIIKISKVFLTEMTKFETFLSPAPDNEIAFLHLKGFLCLLGGTKELGFQREGG